MNLFAQDLPQLVHKISSVHTDIFAEKNMSFCSVKAFHIFYAPRYKMAEGHIEFTLSLCVCMCVCVLQNRVWAIT